MLSLDFCYCSGSAATISTKGNFAFKKSFHERKETGTNPETNKIKYNTKYLSVHWANVSNSGNCWCHSAPFYLRVSHIFVSATLLDLPIEHRQSQILAIVENLDAK